MSDILKGLAKDIARVILRRAITEPLAGAVSTGIQSFLPGKAAGGPVSGPVIVGEKGPEVFDPGRSGTIIPNDQLGRGGNQFFIDARGADREGLRRVEAAIAAVNGSVERRAVSAVANARIRGGGVSKLMRA